MDYNRVGSTVEAFMCVEIASELFYVATAFVEQLYSKSSLSYLPSQPSIREPLFSKRLSLQILPAVCPRLSEQNSVMPPYTGIAISAAFIIKIIIISSIFSIQLRMDMSSNCEGSETVSGGRQTGQTFCVSFKVIEMRCHFCGGLICIRLHSNCTSTHRSLTCALRLLLQFESASSNFIISRY